MFANRFFRITVWTLGVLALLILAGFLWLRQSPYWAGITLFAEDYRVQNFRDMDRVFPSRPVARAGPVWATLFPYTTLFRSECKIGRASCRERV